MLSGAKDIKKFWPKFETEILRLEGIPLCFMDGKFYHDSFLNWEENSQNTVESSDIVIFLINEIHGNITWATEYKKVKETGKPFLIFCLDSTYTEYLKYDYNDSTEVSENKKMLFEQLQTLEKEKRTIIPFPNANFDIYLKKNFSILFKKSLNVLQEQNKRNSLIELVKTKDPKKLKEITVESNKIFLKGILRDIFQPKELRKRILESFIYADLKLTVEEVKDLFYDPEQGIVRKTISSLPQILTTNSNNEEIFESLLELCNTSDDVGIDRRAIIAMLKSDPKLAFSFLKEFPMKDEGTPRRIISWLDKNKVKLNKLFNEDKSFYVAYINAIDLCLNYEEKKEDWKELALELKKLAQSENGK